MSIPTEEMTGACAGCGQPDAPETDLATNDCGHLSHDECRQDCAECGRTTCDACGGIRAGVCEQCRLVGTRAR